MAKQLSVTLATDWVAAGQVATLPVMQTAITGALFGNIDRDHFASGTNPIVSAAAAPSSPAVGLGWFDTTTGSLNVWTGSEWISTLEASATAPTSTGVLWFDTTLNITRKYKTYSGLTGWHPVDCEAVLCRAVNTISFAGQPVFHSNSGTLPAVGDGNILGTSAIGRMPRQDIFGVSAETATAGNNIVVYPNRKGVICLANIAASPTLAVGDAVVCSDGALVSSGALFGATNYSGSVDAQTYLWLQHGMPAGCFAYALTARDGTTGKATVCMLGQVGTGRYVPLTGTTPETTLFDKSTVTCDDAPHDVAIPTTAFFDATKHVPYAVRLQLEYNEDSTLPASSYLRFSRTSDFQGSASRDIQLNFLAPAGGAGGEHQMTMFLDVPTNAGNESQTQQGSSGHGLFVTYQMPATVTAPTTQFNTLTVKLIGIWI